MRKSKFNLTHLHSTTFDAGYLVPFLLLDCLPNDSYRLSVNSFIRAQPMLAPLMHEVNFFTQYWFVPYRILWNDWVDFITGGENLQANPAFPVIVAPEGGFETGSLADYFGFPTLQEGIEVSALPFRAYVEIWNTRYRDEDLQNDLNINYGSGKDYVTSTDLLSPSWKRDYFTTARPSTQRGQEVTIPVYPGATATEVHLHTYEMGLFPVSKGAWDYLVSIGQTGTGERYVTGSYPSSMSVSYSWSEFTFGSYIYPSGSDSITSMEQVYTSGLGVMDSTSNQNFQFSPALRDGGNWLWLALKNLSGSLNVSPPEGELTLPSDTLVLLSGSTSVVLNGQSVSVTFSNFPLDAYFSLQSDTRVESAGISSNVVDFVANAWNATDVGVSNSNLSQGRLSIYYTPRYFSWKYYMSAGSSGFINVRDLRLSSALQRYQERALEWGNRYEEYIQREFAIKPRDARIQRPEYLGGGKSILNISEVLQTAEAADTYVGTMRGHGVAALQNRVIRFRCPEHGVIIGLLSVRPKPVYTQGINRAWLKRSRLDFFTPELANIGMQEVFQQELFATKDNLLTNPVFGFQNRYDEYRFHPPRVTGEFRTTMLNHWNMARFFSEAPSLNESFINMKDSAAIFKRPFAEQTQHSYLCMLKNNVRAWRPIPKRAKNILK